MSITKLAPNSITKLRSIASDAPERDLSRNHDHKCDPPHLLLRFPSTCLSLKMAPKYTPLQASTKPKATQAKTKLNVVKLGSQPAASAPSKRRFDPLSVVRAFTTP